MTEWGNFFVAIVSASAALAGLIFVGVSISLARILSIPSLPGRALESLVLLFSVLFIAALCLVPGQSPLSIGLEVLGIGSITWIITLRLDIGMLRKAEASYKKHYQLNILFTQLALLPYIIAGIVIIRCGFTGVYWLIPGIILSFIKALSDAWVLLLEIHR